MFVTSASSGASWPIQTVSSWLTLASTPGLLALTLPRLGPVLPPGRVSAVHTPLRCLPVWPAVNKGRKEKGRSWWAPTQGLAVRQDGAGVGAALPGPRGTPGALGTHVLFALMSPSEVLSWKLCAPIE